MAAQIERVILSLMHTSFGEDFSEKIVTCLATYRESCINHMKFELYNTFLRELKMEILTASKLGEKFWNLLCAQVIIKTLMLTYFLNSEFGVYVQQIRDTENLERKIYEFFKGILIKKSLRIP